MRRSPHILADFRLLNLISAIHSYTRLRLTTNLTELPAISPRIGERGASLPRRPCPPANPIVQVNLVASSLQGRQAREYGLHDDMNVLVMNSGIDLGPNIRD